MTPDEIREFAERDWSAIEREKERYWIERKESLSPTDALRIGDALREHARMLHPDWPSPADRDADLAMHQRVSEALRSVAVAKHR